AAPAHGAPPPPAPQLSYRGGPLLTAVEVFTVFWGQAWQQAPQSALIDQLNAFFDFVLTSQLIDQLAEYSVPAQAIGYGKRIGTATITSPRLRHAVFDGTVRHMLRQEISVNPVFPEPAANTLYFVYLPPGVSVSQGGDRSCQAFCGYHDVINGRVFYA